jgi:glutamate-1-semialdehyde 2,1-aminomutase
VLGKALSGGFAIGAFGGRRDIMQCLSPLGAVYQAGTYSGNPLSMRCAVATLDAMGEPGVYDYLERIGQRLADGWRAAATRRGVSVQVSQIGSMLGLMFLAKPPRTYRDAIQADAHAFADFFHGLLDRGYLLPTSTHDAVCLSTAHTDEDVDGAIAAADEVFASLSS